MTGSLWGSDIDTLLLNHSSRVQIHKYAGKTPLNYPPFGASVETIPDLQTVCSDTDDCEDTKLCNPTTSGVHELQSIFL